MKVGMIGAGNEVVLSNRRGAESLKDLVAELGSGAHVGTVQEAAKQPGLVTEK